MISHRLRILPIAAALACAAPAMAAPASSGKPSLHWASVLIGEEVKDARGWEVGEFEDVLVDPATHRAVFAVLTVGGRFQANGAPVALKLPSDELIAEDASVRTRGTMEELDHLPAVPAALEELPPDVRARLYSAKALIGADLRDHAGRDVGAVEDLIVSLAQGTFPYAVVDFDPAWLTAGKFVALRDLDVRRTAAGGDVELFVDGAAMESAPAYRDARWPALSEGTFSGRLKRWTTLD